MLRTFGGLELVGSDFTRPRPLLLLAYLLVEHGGRAERAALAAEFYATHVDQSDNLTTDISRLPPGTVVKDGRYIEAQVLCDHDEFTELMRNNKVEEAIERYRGPFLDGQRLPSRQGQPSAVDTAVEVWLHGVRREAADAVLRSLLLLIRQAAARHDPTEAARYAERACEIVWDADASAEAVELIRSALFAGSSAKAEAFAEQAREYGVAQANAPAETQVVIIQPGQSTVPNRLSTFHGRRSELLESMHLLRRRACRILTVSGPGGVGKSRLALEVARAAEEELLFRDGLVYLPLERVKFPGLVPLEIAKQLALQLKVGESVWPRLARALKDKRLLLVLDDVEHLVAIGEDLEELLAACPGVDVLASSRRPLGVEGETILRLAGLGGSAEPEDVTARPFSSRHDPPRRAAAGRATARHDAHDLFEARARDVMPSFSLAADNIDAVERICELVEGVPLGVELAAQAMHTLSLDGLVSELENGEGLLAKSVPGRSHRHASASASFEHSWQLLEPDEQAAVSALAVFAGSFSRQAAEAVAGVSLELLKRLIDVSLLRPIADDRYDFQPLVRSQAAAKLAERAEVEAQLLKDLREYFRGSVEELRASLGSRRFGATAAALDADLDNLRLAWRTETDPDALYDYAVCLASYLERRGLWDDQLELGRRALEHGGDHADTAAVCFTLATVHHHRGELSEAKSLLEDVLHNVEDRELRAEALNAIGGVHYQLRELDQAKAYFTEAKEAFTELGVESSLTSTLNNIAAVEYQTGNIAAGMALWEQVLKRHQLAGDTTRQARTHNNLGMALRSRGDLDEAAIHFDKALVLRKRSHDAVGSMISEANIAGVRYEQGDFASAAAIYAELLERYERMGNRSSQALMLNNLASIDEQLGRFTEARRRLLDAELIQEEIQDHTNLATTLNNLALVDLGAGEHRRAAAYAKRAHALAERTSHPAALVYSLTFLGAAKVLGGDYEPAADLLDRAAALASEMHVRGALPQPLLWKARAALREGELVAAEGIATQALDLALELGQRPVERQAVRLLAEIHATEERWGEVERLLRRLLELDIALRHPDLDDDQEWLRQVSGAGAGEAARSRGGATTRESGGHVGGRRGT